MATPGQYDGQDGPGGPSGPNGEQPTGPGNGPYATGPNPPPPADPGGVFGAPPAGAREVSPPGNTWPAPAQPSASAGYFAPPLPPHPPGFGAYSGQGPRPGSGGRRKRPLLAAGATGVLVLALIAGLLFLGGDEDKPQAADPKPPAAADPKVLQPYRSAIASLAIAPGLRYADDSPGGMMKREVTVTADGSRFGSSGFGREELDREVLSVGGRTFTRWRVDPAGKDGAKKPSVWNAGTGSDAALTDEVTEHRPSPRVLAERLFAALAEVEEEPPADGYDTGSRTLDGTEAQTLATAAGRLVVTRTEPFRLLRLEPPSGWTPGGGASRTADPASYIRTAEEGDGEDDGPFDGADTQALDLDPVTGPEASRMYDTLKKHTEELSKAGDAGISLSLNGSGTVRCSSGGCTATSKFSGNITSDAKSRLVGGEVTAVMTATFSIDGRSGGSCTSSAGSFPVTGSSVSGSLSCSNPGAGATFSSVESQKKAEARARSRANGGRPVQYSIPLRAESLINARALATVELKKLVDRVGKERKRSECLAPRSSGAAPQSLLADGPPSRPAGSKDCGEEMGPGWFPGGTSNKVPRDWSGPHMTKKYRQNANKPGFVWRAPKGQDSVRIDKGDPNSKWATQQVDHVVINHNGRIVGRDGKLLPPGARIQDYPEEAHIPMSEWLGWTRWYGP